MAESTRSTLRARWLGVLALAVAAGCDTPTAPPVAEPEPAPAPAVTAPDPFAGARASVRFVVRSGTAAFSLAGEGRASRMRYRVTQSGGYSDGSGGVIRYTTNDSIDMVLLSATVEGVPGGLVLWIPGVPPREGSYTVRALTARPPFRLAEHFRADYVPAGCVRIYVAQAGTLTVTRSADGELEGSFQVEMSAPGSIFVGVPCGTPTFDLRALGPVVRVEGTFRVSRP